MVGIIVSNCAFYTYIEILLANWNLKTSMWLTTFPLFQIVCGILILVMGTVACIDDRGAITNLGLGIPAGLATVMATGNRTC